MLKPNLNLNPIALVAAMAACQAPPPLLSEDVSPTTTIALFGFALTKHVQLTQTVRFSFAIFNKTGAAATAEHPGQTTMKQLHPYNFRGDPRLIAPSCRGCSTFETHFTDYGGTCVATLEAPHRAAIRFGAARFELPPLCDDAGDAGADPVAPYELVSCAGPLSNHPDPDKNEKVVDSAARWLAALLQQPFRSKVVLYPHDATFVSRLLERVARQAPSAPLADVAVVNLSHAFYLRHRLATPNGSASSNEAVHNYLAQTMLYQHCYNTNGATTDWIQFIDTDEHFAGNLSLDKLLRRHRNADYVKLCKCNNGVWTHGHDPKYLLHSKRTFPNVSIGPWVHKPYGYGIGWDDWTRDCVARQEGKCASADAPHLDHTRVW